MSSDVNDTEFVHFEVVAERPKRGGARRLVVLVLFALLVAGIGFAIAQKRRRPSEIVEPGESDVGPVQ
jgi:hypothetical protein